MTKKQLRIAVKGYPLTFFRMVKAEPVQLLVYSPPKDAEPGLTALLKKSLTDELPRRFQGLIIQQWRYLPTLDRWCGNLDFIGGDK